MGIFACARGNRVADRWSPHLQHCERWRHGLSENKNEGWCWGMQSILYFFYIYWFCCVKYQKHFFIEDDDNDDYDVWKAVIFRSQQIHICSFPRVNGTVSTYKIYLKFFVLIFADL